MYALISRAGEPAPQLEQVERPALPADRIRVEVSAAAFTLYDAATAADHAAFGLPDVIGLGFDFSGTVIELGTDVTDLAVGDRVAGLHTDVTSSSRAHASEVVVPATDVAVLPDGLSFETAAAATLTALTARQAVDLLGADHGSLLVTGGAGAVGGWAIALAKRDGWTVDALARPGTEQLAREAGATEVFTELPERAYDAVLDAAALQQDALGAIRDGGRFVGVKPGRVPTSERDIDVSVVLSRADSPALAELLSLSAKGEVPVRIAATRPLADAAKTYAEATEAPGSDGRWLLVP
ncbi:MAG: hypothetical protein JWR83_2124 [Aeromicrobium sp.]|nr:hypothetical protein [Aeromicrobium sp.]